MSPTADDLPLELSCSICGETQATTFRALMHRPVMPCDTCGAPAHIAERELAGRDERTSILLKALDKTMREAENPTEY